MNPKQIAWAVAVTERQINGQISHRVCIRERKNPPMMIPYQAVEVETFAAAKSWADKKIADGFNVELHYAKQYNKWNDAASRVEYGEVIELVAPEYYGQRFAPVCEVCGNKTRSVLDGEAWCDNCGRYQ